MLKTGPHLMETSHRLEGDPVFCGCRNDRKWTTSHPSTNRVLINSNSNKGASKHLLCYQ